MELRQLQHFLVVAEELHFGRAAERLVTVQSVVSQQIRRLERELGIDLFDRTTRTVTLTEAGRRLIPHARQIFAAVEQARIDLDDLRHERHRTVRLGTTTGLGSRLDAILELFNTTAPAAHLELCSVPLVTRLRQVRLGVLDAALLHGALPEASDLRAIHVWNDELLAVLPADHPLAQSGEVTLAELGELPLRLATRERNGPLYVTVIDSCAAAGFAPTFGPPFSTGQDTLAAIAAGPPTWTVYYATEASRTIAPGVKFCRIHHPTPTLPAYLAVRPGQLTSELQVLLRACRHAAQQC
ncbi:MAG: LysR family transcriptional regulator [Mycobacteriaceae bacterium]|nr:LysR family transcriptional regulator [Mycobacteriaceae bacterium]